MKLRDAFGLDDLNKLPLSFDLAWYEQKAVAVLLALLALGNLSFWLCDRALTAITPLYRQRIAPRLKKKF